MKKNRGFDLSNAWNSNGSWGKKSDRKLARAVKLKKKGWEAKRERREENVWLRVRERGGREGEREGGGRESNRDSVKIEIKNERRKIL